MGLDQYAYVAAKAGQRDQWWEGATKDPNSNDWINDQVAQPRELAYWRKHPNLQGWMERLWRRKMHDAKQDIPEDSALGSGFNNVELELTWEDLDCLEQDIRNNNLPETRGFFFGETSDDYYRERDLDFIKNAKAEIFLGLKVFYNSSW